MDPSRMSGPRGWLSGSQRRGAFLGEEKPRYIGCPERPGNNERLGRRGNFIALGRSMCAARLRGRSQARRRARGEGLRGRDLSNFRNTRALGVSNQTPPFLYGLYLSRSFFPLAPYFPFRPTPSPFPPPPVLLYLPSPLFHPRPDTPFTRFPVTSPSSRLPPDFRSSAGSARPMIPDFSIPRLPAGKKMPFRGVDPVERFPEGNAVPEIESRMSPGTALGLLFILL